MVSYGCGPDDDWPGAPPDPDEMPSPVVPLTHSCNTPYGPTCWCEQTSPCAEWHCPNCQITNSGHVDECVRCGYDRNVGEPGPDYGSRV